MELNGKIFVITGAARGIGADAARRFVGMGAHVAALDVDEDGLRLLEKESDGSISACVRISRLRGASKMLLPRRWGNSVAWTFLSIAP